MFRTLLGRKSPRPAPVPVAPAAPALQSEALFIDAQDTAYYTYADPLSLPVRRHFAVEGALRQLELGLTRDRLTQLVQAALSALDRLRPTEAAGILAEIQTRLQSIVDDDVVLYLAACYTVQTGEDPTGFDPAAARQKVARWKADPAAYDFFLSTGLRHIERLSGISATDLASCLTSPTP